MKRFCALLCALLLCAAPALAEEESLVVTATVQPVQTLAVKAPASGELAPFSLREGDCVNPGDTLFTVEPVRVYASVEGTVAAVHVQPGDIADAAVTRYGAALYVDYAERYVIYANAQTGYNNAENRDMHVGTPVYIRSTNESHKADGVITAVDGTSFTVQVLGGDLVYTQEVKIYSDPEYANKTLLARGRLSFLQPLAVTASGTITHVGVQKGDVVRPGDYLFSYVPDELDPERRGQADATAAKAEGAWIVTGLNVQPGASVQKGQALATVIPQGEYELTAQVEEADAVRLSVGDSLTARFEETELPAFEARITFISPLGAQEGDTTRYTVRLSLPEEARAAVWPGMHATLEK